MIESGHFRAIQRAEELVHKAVTEKRLDHAQIHSRQLTAILELEKARRDIFKRHGVEDLPVDTEGGSENLPAKQSLVEPTVHAGEHRLDELPDIPQRTFNALARHGVKTLEEAAALSDNEILRMRNVWKKTLANIRGLQEKHLGPQPK